MSCLVYEGDPPLCEGCIGCTYAHPPGMLCREQRTALTTRVRCESKRDMGQVTMRLQNLSSLMSPYQRVSDERCKSPSSCCDRTSPFSYSSHLYLASFPSSGHSCASSTLISSDNVVDNNSNELRTAVNLPSDVESKCCRAASSRRRRSCSLIVPKLSKAFVWLSLLCLMYPACIKGSPVDRSGGFSKRASSPSLKNMDENGVPLWVNPCGVTEDDSSIPELVDLPAVSDDELLNQIIIQTSIAKDDAFNNLKSYVSKVFGVDLAAHHTSWKNLRYSFLPIIAKEFGEDLSQEYLSSIQNKIDEVLVDTYENLQKVAVGLEQVVKDAKKRQSPYVDFFVNAEYNLRAVLCEIQVVIIERGKESRPDVTRDIMEDKIRNAPESNVRDWVIMRDYFNMLDYIVQVFTYYRSHPSS